MAKPIRTIRVAVFFGLLLPLLAWCGRIVSADSCRGYLRCGGCSTCMMNVREFGHYQTVWRQWPGDPRPAEVFPRSINAEVLPTPEPREREPLPRTRLRDPAKEPFDPGLPGMMPGAMPGMMPGGFPSEGGILPQEPFDFGPGAPEMPAESGGGSLLESPLPGIPDAPGETEMPEPLPGMPLDSGSPMDFGPPTEQPFSTTPDAGAAMPKLMPPSVTTTDVPLERPLPEVAVPGEAVAQEAPQTNAPSTDIATNALPEPEISEAVDTELPNRAEVAPPEARALQANWMAALHPGFRGEMNRIASSYPSIGSAVVVEPNEVPVKGMPAKQEAIASSHHEQPVSYEQQVDKETVALPVAFGGYCPVELLVNERWVQSDPRCTATYQGRKYLFVGETQRQQFLDDPDHFVPVHSGNDPVLLVDAKRRVPGRMDYCVTYGGRLYMFSKTDTLARFQEKPRRYAAKDD